LNKDTSMIEAAPETSLEHEAPRAAKNSEAAEAPLVGIGVIAAVIIGSFFLRLAGSGTSASLQVYLKELAGGGAAFSSGTVGLIYMAFFAAELLLSPVFGGLSDRFGRKRLMVLGPLLGFCASLIYPFTALLPLLIVGQVLQGTGTAANVPSSLSYLADITAKSPNRSRLMGLFEVASLIGIVAGPVSAPYLWDLLGTNTFRVFSLCFLVAMVIFWFGLHDVVATSRERRGLGDYLKIMTSRRLMRFVPAWLMVNAVFAFWTVHTIFLLSRPGTAPDAPVDAHGAVGGAPEVVAGARFANQALVGSFVGNEISRIYLACGVVFLAGLLFWSFLAARMRRTTVMFYGLGGTFAMASFLYALNHPRLFESLPFLQGWPLFIGFLAALFVQSAFTPVALAYLADVSEDHPENRGVVMGLYSIFLGLGQLLGSSIGGLFARAAGLDGLLLATVLAASIAAVNVAFLRADDPAPDARRAVRGTLH
jgi:MFS family permease